MAFLLALLLSLRVVFVGPVPVMQTFTDVDWFPLGVFDIVVAMSFIVWPFVATWGAKHRKKAAVWTGTLAYLGVSILFVFSFGAEHLVFNGPVMIVGTIWYSIRQ